MGFKKEVIRKYSREIWEELRLKAEEKGHLPLVVLTVAYEVDGVPEGWTIPIRGMDNVDVEDTLLKALERVQADMRRQAEQAKRFTG